MTASRETEIVIVGSGFSGLGAAIELKRIGVDNFVVLEKADDLGGTWRDNTYPGLTVDVASTSYSYGFFPKHDWSRLYARGSEVKKYADECAEKFKIRDHIEFSKSVESSSYNEEDNLWVTKLTNGEIYTSRYLVSATGLFGPPKLPDIDGIETFSGHIMHTGAWEHEYDLSDKRVGVIGTGATAIQMIPEIVPIVEHLSVFQRTPIWLLPKPDIIFSERIKKLFRVLPFTQKVLRLITHFFNEILFGIGFSHNRQFPWLFQWLKKLGISHIRKQVEDPTTQEKLTPQYDFFCKRPSFSNVYFPVFNEPNVDLVTDPISRIQGNSVQTHDGHSIQLDALICATGFSVFDENIVPSFKTFGLKGIELGAYWQQNRFTSFQGISVPNFPNYFMIFGPYSAASASWFGMIDTQVRHLSRCLRTARKRNANYIEVTRKSLEIDFNKILKRRKNQLVFHGDCSRSRSYYFDKNGDVPLIRPATQLGMWLRSHLVSMKNYNIIAKG